MCGTLATEIEGIKLDLVILQKRLECKENSAVIRSSVENNETTRLKSKLLVEKEKLVSLEEDICLIVKNRNEEVRDLNKIIYSLEDKITKLEKEKYSLLSLKEKAIQQDETIRTQEERDSLRLALHICKTRNKHQQNEVLLQCILQQTCKRTTHG